MKVAVAGCHGFIGGHLADRLLAEGHTVVGFDDRERPSWAELEGQRIEIAEPEAIGVVARALEGCEAVFHLAARRPVAPDLVGFIRGNILRTAHLLQAMKLAGVGRLVHASTVAVVGRPERLPIDEGAAPRPESVYQFTKLQAERLAELFARAPGASATVLRMTGVYGARRTSGPVHAWVQSALEGRAIHLAAGGRVRRDHVHVADVVAAHVLALSRKAPGSAVYHIGSGEAPTDREVVDLVFSATGRRVAVEVSDASEGTRPDVVLDISRARAALGYAPTPLRNGLAGMAAALGGAGSTEASS